MKESILEVKNLHFAYDEHHTVLDGISLSVFAGERIAILGSNGAGKSTFFLNLNGVLTPAEGEISYRGTKITRKTLKKLRQYIGIVFQDADNQIIASSVLAEVSFGPMNLKLPRSEVEERVNTALNYMNISQFKDRPPHYLSGGEKKRVSIADIIAMKSEIIIFDELPGIPSIYYGSEWGIEGRKQGASDDAMRPQLDLEKMQKENPHPELTAHIAALGKMRKENPVLADGKYRELVLTNRQYAYARIKDQDAIVVAANNDENPADMSIPVPVDGTYENAFTKEAVPVVDGRLQVHLDACESKVFRKK